MNQQTSGINKNIVKKGCKYLCHLKIAELVTGRSLSVEALNKTYKAHKDRGSLDNECDVIKPTEITRDFIFILGQKSNIRQIGSIVNGDVTF